MQRLPPATPGLGLPALPLPSGLWHSASRKTLVRACPPLADAHAALPARVLIRVHNPKRQLGVGSREARRATGLVSGAPASPRSCVLQVIDTSDPTELAAAELSLHRLRQSVLFEAQDNPVRRPSGMSDYDDSRRRSSAFLDAVRRAQAAADTETLQRAGLDMCLRRRATTEYDRPAPGGPRRWSIFTSAGRASSSASPPALRHQSLPAQPFPMDENEEVWCAPQVLPRVGVVSCGLP